MLTAFPLFIGGPPSGDDRECLPHCSNPCAQLNGPFRQECGLCDAQKACNPHMWERPASKPPSFLEGVRYAMRTMGALSPSGPPRSHPQAMWVVNTSGGEAFHDASATWACHIVGASSLAAATIVLDMTPVMALRCCVAECASSSCDAIDLVSGRGAHVHECGACPRTAPAAGCGPGNRKWEGRSSLTDEWSSDGKYPRWYMTTCRAMIEHNVTNSMHVRFFLAQQQAQRQLLDAAEKLCDGVALDGGEHAEATYQQQLHALLQPYRMATRMHTTAAFLAKAVCVPAAHSDRDRANSMQVGAEAQALYMNGFWKRGKGAYSWMPAGRIDVGAVGFEPAATCAETGAESAEQ